MFRLSYFLILHNILFVVNSISIQPRIHGGIAAETGEFPFHASLYLSEVYFCGGALITRLHVLSAAHCLYERMYCIHLIVVRVGSIELNQGQTHTVSRITHFKGFTKDLPFLYPGDILVTHLTKPVEVSKFVAPIRLPVPKWKVFPKAKLIVIGFGSTTSLNGPPSNQLLKCVTKVIPLKACESTFKNYTIQDSKICASRGVDYGCCSGDSGGPVVDMAKLAFLGIISTGTGNCGSGDPEIFTKVSHYIPYIQAELNYNPKRLGMLSIHPAVNFYQSILMAN